MYDSDIRSNTELVDVARLFFGEEYPEISINSIGNEFSVKVKNSIYRMTYTDKCYKTIPVEHMHGRLSKIAVYDALSAFTGKIMPWGALTGVRPTKLFYELLKNGIDKNETTRLMQKIYRISEKRAKILSDIISAQSGKVEFDREFVNLYVHIPYCTTRCSYCSFVSMPIDKCRKQSIEYVNRLCDEIRTTRDIIEKYGKKVLSVYIGGGTPTSLDDKSFDAVLSAIGSYGVEYTCEAGRPDTVTKEKCDIMKTHGITRVCVNPQTMNDDTLSKIGRKHTVTDFYKVYDIVSAYGFDINCDLIAGLAEETPIDFKKSFDSVTALSPQNITVHSLSKKNGSAIRYDSGENFNAAAMLDYALDNSGKYVPYYLYRQKRQAGNLENVGFSLVGNECINNITTMEETVGVLACGAGAISKVIGDGTITRFANMRDVGLYISRFDEKMQKRADFFYDTLSK